MIQFELASIDQISSRMKTFAHMDALADLPEYFEADVENGLGGKSGFPFKAAVFNMEQGTRLDKIIPFFRHHPKLQNVDIILANELDYGMKRSGNLHTTKELGKALGMNYAYGIEFITTKYKQNGDSQALHGNAILSKYPLYDVKLVHLPIEHEWYNMPNDSRLGVRMAVMAKIQPEPGREVGIVSVHLENRATPEGRKRQLIYLLEQVQAHFGRLPVLIGGDMNTNTVDGDAPGSMDVFLQNEAEQQRRMKIIPQLEPLMDCVKDYGYSYEDCNIMIKPTRRKPMPDGSTILLNLDWFFQKGLNCSKPERVETLLHLNELVNAPDALLQHDGFELSDHDAITVEVTF
ncbi:endonuclease/exonuclease/phosphatase family protein [Eubacteriales bacterium OttesenSCG-928-K08]|nr:endonuclease/exonuclease/phosphatase family protein [Eubacteriales bacterium OttesenSCG-928-K08]